MQRAVEALLHGVLSKQHEWLLLNGCVAVYAVAEPLVALGHAAAATPFLTWCALTMEAVVNLAAVPHLHWRLRLYAAVAYAHEDRGKVKACRNVVAHARDQVAKLRRLEELDPPLPRCPPLHPHHPPLTTRRRPGWPKLEEARRVLG